MNSTPFPSFDLNSIREIAAILRESELGEIHLETTDENETPARLRLKRAAPAPTFATPAPQSESSAPAGSTPEEQTAAAAAEASAGATATGRAPTFEITSHAVGVFREAKIPVVAGDLIKVRQVLGSVESLRVPNEIVAPSAGRIARIAVRDGQGVEFGQTLFEIEEM
jgi:biotin carboxyl carrier protein